MATAMSLSSFVSWESGWLSPVPIFFDETHGLTIVIGIIACFATFAWSCLSSKSLRLFLEKVCPLLVMASLVLSLALHPSDFEPLGFAVDFAIPVAGTYFLSFAWFFLVAAKDVETGILSLLLAWVLSTALRAFFGSFEADAVRAVSLLLLVGITWALLIVQSRYVDPDMPMVANELRDNRSSYTHALRSLWKCVLYCGAFAFLAGLIRSLSLQQDVMASVNQASVLGGLVSAIVLMALWRTRTVRYSINHVFRAIFPVLVLVMCALPFCGMEPFFVVAAALYMVYSFMTLSLQVLCIQTAHDYGVSPLFCYGFKMCVSIGMQGLGYLLGSIADHVFLSSVSPLASIALLSLAMLALVLYLTRGLTVSQEEEGRSVELLSLTRKIGLEGSGSSGSGEATQSSTANYGMATEAPKGALAQRGRLAAWTGLIPGAS